MVTQQMSLDCIRSSLDEAGQGHVLRFYEKLNAAEQEALLGQLKMIPINLLGDYFREATAENTEKGDYKLLPPNPSEVIKRMDNEGKWEEWQKLGMTAIKDGKVAVVTLAGGQGTRLGSALPKGCYKIGLLSDKSLFQIQAERILRLAALTGTQVQWYVMTSAPTHTDTLEFFQANNYFGLSQERVQFFQQGFLPAFDLQGKIMMKSKGLIAVAPDGNGGIYAALAREGILEDMARKGIEYIHMHSVDNCLVLMADPMFVGMAIQQGADLASKSVPKTNPKESVGVLCRRSTDNKMVVAEYSELDPALADAVGLDGSLLFNEANIANHLFSRKFLEQICLDRDFRLRFHVARKKIPSINMETGDPHQTPPMGIKLEAFIFDVLEFAKHPVIFQVDRKAEFAPLKNAPGSAPEDTPEFCAGQLYALHKEWLLKAGAFPVGDGPCEISPLLSYSGEGLEHFSGSMIQLPVHLEKGAAKL